MRMHLIVLLALGVAVAAVGAEVGLERRFMAMGTVGRLCAAGGTPAEQTLALESALRAIEAAERRLSTWGTDSELARLNRAATGIPVLLSPALDAELQAVRDLHETTGGAFDPFIGPLVAAWDLRGAGRTPDDAEIQAAQAASGAAAFSFPGPGVAVRQRAGAWIEEGAFGKGAGLAAALRAAQASAPAVSVFIDLGGQVTAGGPAHAWPVTLAHPDRRDEPLLHVTLEQGSISTSGNSVKRGEGAAHGHLLDPRTGYPAPDFGSVSVWAEDPLAADALSTGLFVLGATGALAWAESQSEAGVLVAARAGEAPVRLHASALWHTRLGEPHRVSDVGGASRSRNTQRYVSARAGRTGE